NREVLKHVTETTRIFDAWSDQPWTNEGAAVRVSLVCFGKSNALATLAGQPAETIFADLTAEAGLDLTTANRLPENAEVAYLGMKKGGSFDIELGACAAEAICLWSARQSPA